MNCTDAIEQLGPYLDGELSADERAGLDVHLADCASCRSELDILGKLTSRLAIPATAPVPDTLWTAIEQRLDGGVQASPDAKPPCGRESLARPVWLRRAPLALAASVILAVGLGIIGLSQSGSQAAAATIDFRVLLEALPEDAGAAFHKFLQLYDAREGSVLEARAHAPDLNFAVPDVLPCGFRLQTVYLLRFGHLSGVAATYDRGGEFLGVVFHRPILQENHGPHRDYPCAVGRHEGHKVSVGEWKLVHLTDPTTCHCLLSKLDEETELPAVMAAIAPRLPLETNEKDSG